MVRIVFLPGGQTVAAAPGATLREAALAAGFDLPVSCGMGRCIADLLEVHSGAHLLELPDPDEEQTLTILGLPGDLRLACVARIKANDGDIVAQWRHLD